METMLAAVLRGPEDLVVERIPAPQPGPDEVLCEVHACGICGSDLRYLAGENPWAKHTLGVEKPNPPDMVLGHEVSGVVEMSGRRVRAGLLAFRPCGDCPQCRRGASQLCRYTAHLGHGAGWANRRFNPGGMAELMPVWRENVYELPDRITFDQATFLDGLGVAIHAVSRAGVRAGDRVAVLGAGPIGLLIMQAALAEGASGAAASDIYDAALSCAGELGAEVAFDGRELEPDRLAAEVLQWTSGRGVDAAFDSTGERELQRAGLSMLAPGGTLVLMAGAAEGLTLDPAAMAGERVVTTSSNNLREDFERGLKLLTTGEVMVEPMITHRFALADALRAFEVAADKHRTGAVKVIIHPR
ncbi:MAG: alcohol dehydrogenase catalytic domain-containing protein [Armatimonadota bacterium]|nr:alcohol dehydrogenase catalytic domain-containing protein [Armatimonadota bacterium]